MGTLRWQLWDAWGSASCCTPSGPAKASCPLSHQPHPCPLRASAHAPASPHPVRAAPNGLPVRRVKAMPPLPSRFRRDDLPPCRPPTAAPGSSTPRGLAALMKAVRTGAGWDVATSAPLALPVAAHGGSGRGRPVTVPVWRPLAPSCPARGWRWLAWSGCWPVGLRAEASAPPPGALRSIPRPDCPGEGRPRSRCGPLRATCSARGTGNHGRSRRCLPGSGPSQTGSAARPRRSRASRARPPGGGRRWPPRAPGWWSGMAEPAPWGGPNAWGIPSLGSERRAVSRLCCPMASRMTARHGEPPVALGGNRSGATPQERGPHPAGSRSPSGGRRRACRRTGVDASWACTTAWCWAPGNGSSRSSRRGASTSIPRWGSGCTWTGASGERQEAVGCTPGARARRAGHSTWRCARALSMVLCRLPVAASRSGFPSRRLARARPRAGGRGRPRGPRGCLTLSGRGEPSGACGCRRGRSRRRWTRRRVGGSCGRAGQGCRRTGSTAWPRPWEPEVRGQDRPVEVPRTAPDRSSRMIRRAQVHDPYTLFPRDCLTERDRRLTLLRVHLWPRNSTICL